MPGRKMTPEEVWVLAWYRLLDNIIEISTFGYVSPKFSFKKLNKMFVQSWLR